MAKKTAPKTTALVKWDEEMAKEAEEFAAGESVGGFKSVNIRSATLMVDDVPVDGNEMDVVVLSAMHENQYFEGDYDPNTPQVPVCYAFSDPRSKDPEGEMAPHPQAPDPQAKNCADCPHNQWGSADRGRGKACKNVRRLALVTADAVEDVETLEEAEVRSLKVSVMSVKGWGSYVKNKLVELKRPCYGVVTNIKVVTDPKSQHKILFKFKELVEFDGDLYKAMKSKVSAAEKDMAAPYPEPQEEAPRPKKSPARRKRV